ncbi:MAG: ATP-binding protein [Clostridiales bacterium]|jgi:hypothetical protein|nr:ATP-binding protein [Clostridiales bacterium]
MMMKELSLHILDIVQNSIVAGATLIEIAIKVDHAGDWMAISVSDNGRGMDKVLLSQVESPFTTSRTTRKVGLGIPMFKAGAEGAGGSFTIKSTPGKGAYIEATYQISHLDRPPLGDIAGTLYVTVVCNDTIDIVFRYTVDDAGYSLDTREIRAVLGEDVPFNTPEVSQWIKNELAEGIHSLNGGV